MSLHIKLFSFSSCFKYLFLFWMHLHGSITLLLQHEIRAIACPYIISCICHLRIKDAFSSGLLFRWWSLWKQRIAVWLCPSCWWSRISLRLPSTGAWHRRSGRPCWVISLAWKVKKQSLHFVYVPAKWGIQSYPYAHAVETLDVYISSWDYLICFFYFITFLATFKLTWFACQFHLWNGLCSIKTVTNVFFR